MIETGFGTCVMCTLITCLRNGNKSLQNQFRFLILNVICLINFYVYIKLKELGQQNNISVIYEEVMQQLKILNITQVYQRLLIIICKKKLQWK